MNKKRIIIIVAVAVCLIVFFVLQANSLSFSMRAAGLETDDVKLVEALDIDLDQEFKVLQTEKETGELVLVRMVKNKLGFWEVADLNSANSSERNNNYVSIAWVKDAGIKRFTHTETPVFEYEWHYVYCGYNAKEKIEFLPEQIPNNVTVNIQQAGEYYLIHVVTFADPDTNSSFPVWDILKENSSTTGISEDQDLADNVVDGNTLVQFLTINTLSEYEEHFASKKEISDFVTYDMIKEIGEFKTFTCRSNFVAGDYSAYHYVLIDSSGIEFMLNIKTVNREDEEKNRTILDIQPGGNMRKTDADETGYLYYKDIWYRYSKGKLASVTWYKNNLRFQLTAVSDTFANHPEDAAETFVGKLLSAETAQATIASLPIFEAVE